jgi:putative flippase GtrA
MNKWYNLFMLNTREKRFLRYGFIGFSTFILDLFLLWIFVEMIGLSYIIAAPIAFILAASINYTISRKWVFRGSKRSLHFGYLYFLKFAFLGAAITTLLMFLIITKTTFNLFTSRAIVASLVGIGNYLANLYLNFKVAGQKLD